MKFNTAERRALQAGTYILKPARNSETGDLYDVEVKLAWGLLYFRLPTETEWHRKPGDARRAALATDLTDDRPPYQSWKHA